MSDELRTSIADVRAIAGDPSIKQRLRAIGIRAHSGTPEEFTAAIEEQRTKVAAIATANGTKPLQLTANRRESNG